MKHVEVNSRWTDTQLKDRRVKVREIETEDNVTYVYYGQHAEDTTYMAEVTAFLDRFKPLINEI